MKRSDQFVVALVHSIMLVKKCGVKLEQEVSNPFEKLGMFSILFFLPFLVRVTYLTKNSDISNQK